MNYSAAELFTPAPSGVGPFGNVPNVPAQGTWLGQMLANAATVGLPTTSWQSGAPERTIFAVESVMFSKSDVNISIIAQGGFLQTAADGSVTTTTTNGTTAVIPVTPDPSNPAQNPTGALGWLDELTTSVYDVSRLAASYATGPLAIVKTNVGSVSYAAGQYHAGNTQTGATYTNTDAITIPPSSIAGTGGVVVGVAPGSVYTIVTTQTAHGLTAGQFVYVALPTTSGISFGTPTNAVFAIVTAVTSTTFQIAVPSSGTWAAGGAVYLCTVVTMRADLVGIGSNAGPGAVTTAVTQNAGVLVSNVVGWSGSNWESNDALAGRAQNSLAAASPNGPSQAYVYFADTASQLFTQTSPPTAWTSQHAPYALTNGPVRASNFSNPQTEIVTTVVASLTPASTSLGAPVTPGVAQLQISNVSNGNPCLVDTANPTTLVPGQSMTVTIAGVLGVAGVNSSFLGTYVSGSRISIPIDTTSAGTYLGGGTIEGGDLGQIDLLLQENVVPSGETAITVSALALPVNITATVLVPQANLATYQLRYLAQLQAQIASYLVGGNLDSAGNPLPVAYNDIVGALEEAGQLVFGGVSYATVSALSLNGGGIGVGVVFPSNFYEAILGTVAVTVLGT